MEKDLEYYKKLPYDIVLKKKNGRFVLFIPELCCLEEDPNLEKAYEKLELEKERYFQEMIESGSKSYIKEPEAVKHKKSNLFSNLAPFTIKLVMVVLIVAMGMQVVAGRITSLKSNIFIKPHDVVTNLNNKLKSMPPERKEEIRMELREVIQNVKPFIDEFRVLLDDKHEKKTKSFVQHEQSKRNLIP